MAGGKRAARQRPEERKAAITRAARQVFYDSGYGGAGLVEVAAAGEFSRALIYRYFPEGRPELFRSVVEDLISELQGRLHYAAGVPFSAAKRMEQLLAALFTFFQDDPDAFRLLFREVWSAGDPDVEATARAARSLLGAEIATVVAETGEAAEQVLAASAGILGFALANVELTLAGQVDAETAWQVTSQYATSQLLG